MKIKAFQQLILGHSRNHRRDMPWRPPNLAMQPDGTLDPYAIVISEVMLQQTQVARVIEKYPVFMSKFSNFSALSTASSADVLRVWQGLGYNRRALYLHRLSQGVMASHGGQLPRHPAELIKLPGIGPGTVGSIAAFAFNMPVVFIETNIRRVFIHHFFNNQKSIPDSKLLSIIEEALDCRNPREWYYALMDYGAHLAATIPNPNRRSKHHAVQSKFEGSDRQIRGQVLRILLNNTVMAEAELAASFRLEDQLRLQKILAQLAKEGFIISSNLGHRLVDR